MGEAASDIILDTLEIGVMVIAQGRRIASFNPWMERQSRLSREEVLGRSYVDVLGPVSARVQGSVDGVLESGRPAILSSALNKAPFALFETETKQAENERFEHVVHLRPVRFDGRQACCVQVIDVSASVRREAVLRAKTQEALAARRFQQEFLSRMSHEIRTPLNGILALTELVLQGSLDEELTRNLQVVHQSGETLLKIVNDVLDISKIEAGKMSIDEVPSDVAQIVSAVVGVHRIRATQKGIALRLVIEDDVPPGITIDPLRIQQVLMNLLGNAVKFTEKGFVKLTVGILSSEKKRLSGAGHLCDAELCFRVLDTGIGIDDPTILFREYIQADQSISRRFGGTGLGLSISRRLVELMGGNLSVKSKVGEGTEFSFKIPVRVTESARKTTLSPIEFKVGGHALVVDDNRVNRMVAGKVLERLGFTYKTACGGEEALELIGQESFDVVLMDCHMPGLDGYDTTRRIRDKSMSQLPIIAVTANALDGERERCLEAGMNDYLTKPITIRALSEVLHRFQLEDAPGFSHERAISTQREVGVQNRES